MGDVLTLYGISKKGEFGTLLGCTVLKILDKNNPKSSRIFVIASAVELIEYITRCEASYRDKVTWKSHTKFQLIIDSNANSNNDSEYLLLKFSHFITPNAPSIENIVTNLYINEKSLTIVGYSDDSSKNSKSPDLQTFIKKSTGLAVFELYNQRNSAKLSD